MIDWLLVGCIASFLGALVLAAILIRERILVFAENRFREDRADYERQLTEGEGCPWHLKDDR